MADPPRPRTNRHARWRVAAPLLAGALALGQPAARAAADPAASPCAAAIALTEPGSHLPPGLLSAVAVTESGRIDPATGAIVAWPWTIDIGGAGRMFDTQAAAVAAVQAARQAGSRSIDVGCMQVNLFYHPQAFATLEEAFAPEANVRYAARFLADLHAQTGDWAAAVAAYHSATPEMGMAYARRVAAAWPPAAQYGLTAAALSRPLLAAALAAEVDPRNVLTPEFRAQMIEAAAFRHQHAADHRADDAGPAAPDRPGQPRPAAGTVAALEAEVDPRHMFTPQFRAQLVAAAAFRHQRQAAPPASPRPPAAVSGNGPTW